MPIATIVTNVKVDRRAFIASFEKMGNALYNVEGWIIDLQYNEDFYFNGSHDPAFLMYLTMSLGIPAETNAEHSKGIFAYMGKELGIPDHRGSIVFNDPGTDRIGTRSTTLNHLMKK